ncbi:hypothetical protein [Desulfovibrio legallii]|uniref:hypothetical protein n=1 Tax=Desulfovibrio legallii TaxID=571438 RepID=UPI0011C21E47|nr:hypothetical protein [Desulfovibrio legallii]
MAQRQPLPRLRLFNVAMPWLLCKQTSTVEAQAKFICAGKRRKQGALNFENAYSQRQSALWGVFQNGFFFCIQFHGGVIVFAGKFFVLKLKANTAEKWKTCI